MSFIGMMNLKVLKRTWAPDEALIDRLRLAMFDAPEREHILMLVDRGALNAFVTPKGLILLETVDWSRGRELRIYGMVGRDILKRSAEIIADLKEIAEYKGCSMIGGEGIPKGWQRAAPRLGFKPVSTHFLMELNNG